MFYDTLIKNKNNKNFNLKNNKNTRKQNKKKTQKIIIMIQSLEIYHNFRCFSWFLFVCLKFHHNQEFILFFCCFIFFPTLFSFSSTFDRKLIKLSLSLKNPKLKKKQKIIYLDFLQRSYFFPSPTACLIIKSQTDSSPSSSLTAFKSLAFSTIYKAFKKNFIVKNKT